MVVTITNNTEEPLMLSAPESNNRMFAAQLNTNVLGKGYQLKVSTVPPLPAMGSAQGQISLKTAWTNTPIIPVTVVANVQPAVMVIPSYITLAPGPLANAVTNSVAIQNNSTNLLHVVRPGRQRAGGGGSDQGDAAGQVLYRHAGVPARVPAPARPASRVERQDRATRSSRWSRCRCMQMPRPPAAGPRHPHRPGAAPRFRRVPSTAPPRPPVSRYLPPRPARRLPPPPLPPGL